MGRMSYIAYLCEREDRDAIIAELNTPDLMTLTGKSPEEIADGFIAAYKNIRLQKNNPAFDKLNEIQDEMLDFEKNKDENTMQEDEKLSYKDEHICPHGNSKADNCYECDEEENLSQCCSAKIIYHDICSSCKEHV